MREPLFPPKTWRGLPEAWAADGERVGPAHHFPAGRGWSTCGLKHRPEREARSPRRVCRQCLRTASLRGEEGRAHYDRGVLRLHPRGELAVPQAPAPEPEAGPSWTPEAVRVLVLALLADPELDATDGARLLALAEERAALRGDSEVRADAVRAALGHPHDSRGLPGTEEG